MIMPTEIQNLTNVNKVIKSYGARGEIERIPYSIGYITYSGNYSISCL